MFTQQDEYAEATAQASINTYDEEKTSNYKLGVFNLFLLTTIGVMGYVSLDTLKSTPDFLKKISIVEEKQEVSDLTSDKDLLNILNDLDVDSVEDEIIENDNAKMSMAMKNFIGSSTITDDSLYTQALSQEINPLKVRVITVKKGDTLASISEKYYGNSMAYSRIITANKSLNKKSSTIYAGQKLNLPL